MPPWRAKPCIASRSPGWTWLRAVDNHPTRALVDRHIAGLSDVTLISGGNDETDGNVQLVRRRDGLSVDGHLVEIHPEIGEAATSEVTPGTGCAVLAAERPQLVVAGASSRRSEQHPLAGLGRPANRLGHLSGTPPIVAGDQGLRGRSL